MILSCSTNALAKSDLKKAVTRARVWHSLAVADIRSKYRLSTFGSLWITVITGALALSIGLVYGQFFGQDVTSYLPYFTASYVTWIFISSTIGEASHVLVGAGNLIKSSPMPIAFHVLRMLQRNLIVAAHNIIILAAIWLFVRWPVGPEALLSIVGVALLYFFLLGASLVIAIACVRFRDVPQLVQLLTQFLFFASPIIWYPEHLRFGALILKINPVAYVLMVVRDPLLGRPVSIETWSIAVLLAAGSLAAGALVYIRYRNRIAYWV